MPTRKTKTTTKRNAPKATQAQKKANTVKDNAAKPVDETVLASDTKTETEEAAPDANDANSANHSASEPVKQAIADEPPCLTVRRSKPKGYTCLDEMQEAIDYPNHYTSAQYNAIINENNLCANCRAKNEANNG